MISSISRFLHKHSNPRRMLGLLVLNILMFAIVLPLMYRYYPDVKSMVSMDAPVFYDPIQIHTILDGWEAQGRSLQFWFHLIWDTVLPLAYGLLFGFTISWFTRRGFASKSRWQRANALAIGSAFDLLENACIMILIAGYPVTMPLAVWFRNVFTFLKYSVGIILVIIMLVSFIAAWKNRFRIMGEEFMDA